MRQSVSVEDLRGLPRGFGMKLPDLVSEAIGGANIPEGVSITYGGFEPRTCKMHFDVKGPCSLPYSVLTQVTERVASRIDLDRPARPSREPQTGGRSPHLSLVPRL